MAGLTELGLGDKYLIFFIIPLPMKSNTTKMEIAAILFIFVGKLMSKFF